MRYDCIVAAAFLPWPALAAQQCVVGATAEPIAITAPATETAPPSPARPPVPPLAIPPALGGLPFVRNVASAGAQLFDFGVVHGIRLVGARNGSEFRVFSVLPDGQSAIEGAPLAMTINQLVQLAGSDITKLDRLAGVDGLFVRSGAQFQVFYGLPDGQGVVPGILRDVDGHNLTRKQVQEIPGAVPTVELQAGSPAPAGGQKDPEAALATVHHASFGSIGPADAPEIFMMIDPQCIYSIRAFQQLQPYAAAGKIKLSLVPVSILDHEDGGRSTKSALALLSKSAGELPGAWQRGDTNGAPTPEAQARLASNMAIANAVGLQGTPTLLWKDRTGRAARIDGVPTDLGALLSSVGG